MPIRLKQTQADFSNAFTELLGQKRESDEDVGIVVSEILKDVRVRGDQAVIDYSNRFDRLSLTSGAQMRVSPEEIDAAVAECDNDTLGALKVAAERISSFHEKQMPDDLSYTDEAGVELGYRWTAIKAVGIYVPGGLASYPSSVLMNALPARVAGVDRLVMVVPTPDNKLNPLVLAAAHICGIDEIYRVGGAQAIAALAFGTETIAAVDKIVGPGNAYVATAKKQVFGTVGIDMIAGPSEILVVADNQNDPSWIAADLLSQAEHDPVAQSILITDDEQFADDVCNAIEIQLKTLPKADIARASWNDYGAVIIVNSLSDAVPLVDAIAPEHLELCVEDPDLLVADIRHAGSIFLGRHTPEAIGDYVAGPNHVLPTMGTARFSSALGVETFLKKSSIISYSRAALLEDAPHIMALANLEGLSAHAKSVEVRLKDKG